MKTKNNVRKAILKSLAVLTVLVLLSNAINGQGIWKKDYMNNANAVSLAMAGDRHEVLTALTSVKSSAGFTFAKYSVEENDMELELENWMKDADFFAAGNYTETETELPLLLENWMTSENYFNLNETDEALEVENWMLDENVFEANKNQQPEKENVTGKVISTKTFVYSEQKDPELKFEAWMFDSRYWGK